jgi:threonylcarbamoyladenosine tRNA methylthiotransferase CDKAL1
VSIVGVEQIDKIVSVVEETLKGNNVRLLSKRGKGIERTEAMINLPKMSEFIKMGNIDF